MFKKILILFMVIALSGCQFLKQNTTNNNDIGAKESSPIILFTQMAKSAKVDISSDKKSGSLLLVGVHPETIWFTDRPYRNAGDISNADFISSWSKGKNSFSKNPPNASLVYLYKTPDNIYEQGLTVVKLNDPKYNAVQQTLQYKFKFLGEKFQHDPIPPAAEISHVALFIDSASDFICQMTGFYC